MIVLGIPLDDATLRTAQAVLGQTELGSAGDASGGVSAICFSGRDGTTLAFTQGEIARMYQLLRSRDDFDFSGDDARPRRPEEWPRCRPLARLSDSTATNGGLALGMTLDAVTRLLGQPTRQGPGFREYESCQPEGARAERFDWGREACPMRRWLRIELRHGRVSAIRANQGADAV